MSIRLSDHDVSFDDKTLRAMGKAYDHACDALGCFGIAVTVREIIAKRIVEVARMGERDPTRLYREALRTFEHRRSQPTSRSVGQDPQSPGPTL
jgi:hypothetical protein